MNKIRRHIAPLLILTFLAVVLLACESAPQPPVPGTFGTPQPGYAAVAAQSTLDYGQNQMNELYHQATVVGLNMAQAANVAEQATLDYHQRQMMELAYQATVVSLNMAQAAATQQFIAEQTQMVWNATATAQSQAATATYSTYILNVTQTAHAQAILDNHATETAQAIVALTAIPLTITPLAATQAAILFQQKKYERQSFWREIVTPLKVVLTTLVILLLIVGSILAFRRFMPVLEFRLLNPPGNGNISPLFLVDGVIVDLDPRHRRLIPSEPRQAFIPQLPSDATPQVEIIGPTEPSIINWVTEAEQKLRADGRNQL
jgi:hypothetical protein